MFAPNETVAVKASSAGFAIVAQDRMAGWRVVPDTFTEDRSYALVRAAGMDRARALPAVQEDQEVCAPGRRPSARRVVLVDWAFLEAARATGEKWYAVRTKPGAQSMARQLPDPLPHRRGESLIERNLREAGIDVYMPAFWREQRAHRSRKIRERRFPLLVGYVFIRRDPSRGFAAVRDVDGVLDVVTNGRAPADLSEEDIQFLMMEMFHRHQDYRLHRQHKIETARFKRRQNLHGELGRLLPRGRSRTVSLRSHADACIQMLPDRVRDRVLGIMSALDAVEDDKALDEYREAV